MTLKRYLTFIYGLTLGMLLVVCAVMAGDPEFPLAPMLVMSPFIALVNTFVQVWPFARMVPVERRTGFRAYRITNIFMGLIGAVLVLGIGFKIAGL